MRYESPRLKRKRYAGSLGGEDWNVDDQPLSAEYLAADSWFPALPCTGRIDPIATLRQG